MSYDYFHLFINKNRSFFGGQQQAGCCLRRLCLVVALILSEIYTHSLSETPKIHWRKTKNTKKLYVMYVGLNEKSCF